MNIHFDHRVLTAAPLLIALCGGGSLFAQYTVSTLASNGSGGWFNGRGVAVDNSGNVYATGTYAGGAFDAIIEVRASGNPRILVVAGSNASNASYPVCGGTATATAVVVALPDGITVDRTGNIYISEVDSPAVLHLHGSLLTAPLGNTTNCNRGADGVASDGAGHVFFPSAPDYVYKLATSSGAMTVAAGSGTISCTGTGALGKPLGLAMDLANNLYIADEYCNVIWKVPPSGTPSVVAGIAGNANAGCADGPLGKDTLYGPYGVAVDPDGDLFIADSCGVRMVNTSGNLTTIAADIPTPQSVAVGPGGIVYAGVSDEVLQLTPAGGGITSPSAGSTLRGTKVTFDWAGGAPGSTYELDVSDKIGAVGAGDIFVGSTTANSLAVSGLPCDDRTLYVQLATDGKSPARRYTYKACNMLTLKASPTSLPVQGGAVTLIAKVENLSPAAQTYQLQAEQSGLVVGEQSVTLAAGASQTVTFTTDVGALPSGGTSRVIRFEVLALNSSGKTLDTAAANVTQN